jgi:hypothetical protein
MPKQPYDTYTSPPLDDLAKRATQIIEGVRYSVAQRADDVPNQANRRHMQDFFTYLKSRFAHRQIMTEIQPIPRRMIRTTDCNFIVTVPGKSEDQIVLVAHYDTWAGLAHCAPGADDNASGEEVLKHYLLRDLCADAAPALTHVYLFSGSEECGTRGLLSQFALIIGLYLFGYAVAANSWIAMLAAMLFVPFAVYRFGITGTKHFVASLSKEQKASIRAAIAVDSVGEGRLYIPDNEMGANFIRALFPYEGSEALNDLLEEGAHIHGIKYNRYLAGGTTDSVAFLEERGVRQADRKEARIPAAALLTMAPGKASPFVIGGKIHTRHDTADRIYPEPIQEVLTVLDYAFDILQGGKRPTCPRALDEHHYARIYEDGQDWFVALKDAIEPNRRNINTIWRTKGNPRGKTVRLKVGEVVWWGVETTLDKEMHDYNPRAKGRNISELILEGDGVSVRFCAVRGLGRRLRGALYGVWGRFERLLGRYSFMAIFAASFLIGHLTNTLLNWTLWWHPAINRFLLDHYVMVFIVLFIFQIMVLMRFISRELPAAMDNAYRHLNRADNLGSLRRAARSKKTK